MSTPQSWSRAAGPQRRLGHTIEHHDALASTNDRARELLGTPRGEGIAVVAELQTAGRGRRGRTWLSPTGLNLMCSVALRPSLSPADAWWLGAAASLAVRAACAPVAALWLRWPNDLVAADGRKVAGMLLETAIDGRRLSEAVIGIGVNVNWRRAAMPAEIAAAATSLADLASAEADRVDLLARLLGALDVEIAAAERGESPIGRYRAASWLDGRLVSIELGEQGLEGRVAGIAADGQLLVDTADGRRAVSHAEVLRVRSELEAPDVALPA